MTVLPPAQLGWQPTHFQVSALAEKRQNECWWQPFTVPTFVHKQLRTNNLQQNTVLDSHPKATLLVRWVVAEVRRIFWLFSSQL